MASEKHVIEMGGIFETLSQQQKEIEKSLYADKDREIACQIRLIYQMEINQRCDQLALIKTESQRRNQIMLILQFKLNVIKTFGGGALSSFFPPDKNRNAEKVF